jgi:F-type H+-transporting ATPase subunit delta
MKKGTLHLKLAKTIFALAKKHDKAQLYYDQLEQLAALVSDRELVGVLDRVSGLEQSKLVDILQKSLPKTIAGEIFNLLVMLVSSRQVVILPAIKTAYQKFYFEAEGISDFLVCSSRELDSAEQDKIQSSLGKSGKAHVEFSVDSGLIGGIQIYENGRLMDYSVKSQLEQLRRLLLGEHLV